MLWFVLTVLSGFSNSLSNVFRKSGLEHADEYVVSWTSRALVVVFVLPLFIFFPVVVVGPLFIPALLINAILLSIATILYTKAYKHSDISITSPMIAFTPIFVIIISSFVIREFPTVLGMAGIFLIVIGSYMLNIKRAKGGITMPFRELLKDRGAQLMLLVAFIYGITSVVDKVGVTNSTPFMWIVAANGACALILFLVMIHKSGKDAVLAKTKITKFIPIGFFWAAMLVFQMTAIQYTAVANVIAVKSVGIVFTVLFGYLIFKEKDVKSRMLGALIMLAGLALIAFFG